MDDSILHPRQGQLNTCALKLLAKWLYSQDFFYGWNMTRFVNKTHTFFIDSVTTKNHNIPQKPWK